MKQWTDLITSCSSICPIILLGDFNAHSWAWSSSYNNSRGKDLNQLIEDHDLIPLNDSLPTHVSGEGRSSNNIDLIFVSSQLAQFSRVEVIEETYSSDHFLVVAQLDLTLKYTKSSTNRLNLKKADWTEFWSQIDSLSDSLESDLKKNNKPLETYRVFIDAIIQSLMDSGAYFPSRLRGSRKSQPLWWDGAYEGG